MATFKWVLDNVIKKNQEVIKKKLIAMGTMIEGEAKRIAATWE